MVPPTVDITRFLAELQRVEEQFLGAEHLFRFNDLVHGRALLVFAQKLERRGQRLFRDRHEPCGRIVLEKAVQVVALGMVLLAGKIDQIGCVVEVVRPVAVGGDDGALAIPFGEDGKAFFRARRKKSAGFPFPLHALQFRPSAAYRSPLPTGKTKQLTHSFG